MRRSIAICLAFAWLAAACTPPHRPLGPARPTERAEHGPPLWRVEHGGRVSYLFGTIHLPSNLDATLGPHGQSALASARVVFVEMDLSDARRTRALGAAAVRAGLLPPHESLRGMLSPSLWDRLRQLLPASNPTQLDRLEPWLAALSTIQAIAAKGQLTPATAAGRETRPPMDVVIVARARQRGVPIVELDSMRQQLDAFTALPRAEALTMLRELLAAPDAAGRELRAIVEAYDGDDAEAQLTRLVNDMARRTPTFAEHLLFRRNQRWAGALDLPLRRGGAFVAVGAGHLVGPRGLPALLAARGLHVSRVAPAAEPDLSRAPDRAAP